MTTASSLSALTDPASVAVVGASANPAKWGYWLARGALRGAHRRRVDLVNARGAVIDDTPTVRRLADLDHTPELVVISTPANQVADVIREALDRGTLAFICITAGIDAVTPGSERTLAREIRAGGARLLGPNCLGMYDASHELELAWGTFHPGNVAIISQSGQLGLELCELAHRSGLGVSRFVSIGNQSDITATELADDLVEHAATKTVVVYLESFANGRTLLAALARLRRAGKAVVVLTVGASSASSTAAQSHTGAMTAATDVVAAGCRAVGAVLADTPAHAIDVAQLAVTGAQPRGSRVAVVSDSGGQGAIATDALSRRGMTVPALDPELSDRIAAMLAAGAGVTNPIDLAGAGEKDLDIYPRVVRTLTESHAVDAVVLTGYFGCYGADVPALADHESRVARELIDIRHTTGIPILVHSMSPGSPVLDRLRAGDIPTFAIVDRLVAAAAAATGDHDRPPRRDLAAHVATPTESPTAAPARPLPYHVARELVAEYGLPYPPGITVRTATELDAAVGRLGAPYVLKAGWLAHKTESRGVAVSLAGAVEVTAAFDDMVDRLGDGLYVLEEMDHHAGAVELIVGARRDDSFGPVVTVGLGGTRAELHSETATALAPVTAAEAERMLGSLASAPLLTGWRGSTPVDLPAAAEAVAAVSRVLVDRPEIAECEVNPLRVFPDGLIALDAMVTSSAPAAENGVIPRLVAAGHDIEK